MDRICRCGITFVSMTFWPQNDVNPFVYTASYHKPFLSPVFILSFVPHEYAPMNDKQNQVYDTVDLWQKLCLHHNNKQGHD